MSRRVAREIAMKLAFAHMLGGGGEYDEILDMTGIADDYGEGDAAFADSIVAGVEKQRYTLDHYIGQCSHSWAVENMPIVDACILRVAAYEMLYGEVSDSVAINEAVELAKLFGGERSPSFVNGVLGGLSRAKEDGKVFADVGEKADAEAEADVADSAVEAAGQEAEDA